MNPPRETILIIDDTPTNLAVLFDYLEESGFKILVDTNGASALEAIKQIPPDIILLDVMMPDIDGFETCRRLKANESTRDIPVIFMTALTDTVDEIRGLKLGAVDYITKPVKVETVLARINTHLTIRRLQRRLEKQNAELDAFAHTVAHDLKNPLGITIAYSEMLMEEGEEMEQAELDSLYKNLYQANLRVVNIIDELLLLAGVRKETVAHKPIDMAKVLTHVQERLALMTENYRGKIILPKKWPVATGHAPWIEEVWANYISNGLKYGGSPPRLELGATPQNDKMIRFWVRDNGPGLSPKAQSMLFTEFTRLDKVRAQGYGLGLSIVQRIIDKLGGQVGVESTVGQHSTFYFTLPRAKNGE